MPKPEDYFPLGIAKKEAFIGRQESGQWLQRNIESGIHTVLLAPRRYGKSSLVLNTLENSQVSYTEIDLQLCRSAKSIEKKIISGVENLINQTVAKKEQVLEIAKSFFKKSHKQWKIGLKGFVELTIEPEHYDDVAENILTVLQFLEAALEKTQKKAVIFIDEIQEMARIELSAEIQGALRHFAQKTKQVIFIFSGSNRRLLRQMFEDSTMPLYQLCDTIALEKIPEDIYYQYLQKVSKMTWKKHLPDEIIGEILRLSERHPRRVYHLCLYVWRLSEIHHHKIPLLLDVQEAWQKLIATEAKGVRYFLSRRNNSQLKVLAYIAQVGNSQLTSKEAQKTMDLSSTAIANALQQLEQDDLLVHVDTGEYHFIDPVVKSVIKTYEKELIDTEER